MTESVNAFALLEDLRTGIADHAAPLPLKDNATSEWQGLGFQLGGVRIASQMGQVEEILTMPKMASLAVVKSWVLGIANIRGKLIPIIDLHEYLGLTPTVPMSQWRVLVVEDDDLTAGLVVEQSLGIQHFLEDSFEEANLENMDELSPYVSGAFRHSGRLFYQLNLRAILRDDKFFDVALHETQEESLSRTSVKK